MQSPREKLQYPCALCKNKHALRHCRMFQNLTVPQRLRIVEGHELCRNCLAMSHYTWQCRSTSKCNTCFRGHHTMLHHDEHRVVVTAEERWDRLAIVYSRYTLQLKLTFQVYIETAHESTICFRAVYDATQHRSSITKSAARSVGADLNYSEAQPYCHLRLMSRHDEKRGIVLSLSVDEGEYGRCPPVQADPTPVYIFFGRLPLADHVFHAPYSVDIILGADVTTRVLLKEHKEIQGAPRAVSTIFGWAFEGECPIH